MIVIFFLLVLLIVFYNFYDLVQIDIMNLEYFLFWILGVLLEFVLGIDDQGCDLWLMIFYGMCLLLIIGICFVVLQVFLGILIGLIVGYVGGCVDSFLM